MIRENHPQIAQITQIKKIKIKKNSLRDNNQRNLIKFFIPKKIICDNLRNLRINISSSRPVLIWD